MGQSGVFCQRLFSVSLLQWGWGSAHLDEERVAQRRVTLWDADRQVSLTKRTIALRPCAKPRGTNPFLSLSGGPGGIMGHYVLGPVERCEGPHVA